MTDLFSFFEPEKSAAAKRSGQKKESDAPLTVTSLIAQVKGALAGAFPRRVNLVGEISNFKLHSSGHMYFRLKDSACAIDAAMFRSAAGRLKFKPADGLEVVVSGRVDVYDARGQLQFYVESMTPRGQGALELAFRQLQEKLQAEGLFDVEKKKPIKRFPRAIGIVTSPTGAAVRDIRRTIARRWSESKVYLVPAVVQGDAAAGSIAEAIRLLDANAEKFEIDTIIVGRGGGSLEDLWAFNEEVVARAIYAAQTPIISGVGHEVDVTISDMVADVRAATPTAAAEVAVPDKTELVRTVSQLNERTQRRVSDQLVSARTHFNGILRSAFFRDPTAALRVYMQKTDELSHRMVSSCRGVISAGRRNLEPLSGRLAVVHPARLAGIASNKVNELMARLSWTLGGKSKAAGDVLSGIENRLNSANPVHRLNLARQRVTSAHRQLEAMSYRSVLKRGFSVTKTADGKILRSVSQVEPGMTIKTQLHDGEIKSIAEGKKNKPKTTDKPRSKPINEEPTLF